jgi:putative oxidoreductase
MSSGGTGEAGRRLAAFRIGRLVLKTILAGLFLFAAIAKLADPAAFTQQIMNYQLVPWPVAACMAVFLPALEFCLGICLLLGRLESGALLWVTILLVAFSGALLSAMVRGLAIDCGCFGRAMETTGTMVPLIRNLGLLAVTAALWFSRRK